MSAKATAETKIDIPTDAKSSTTEPQKDIKLQVIFWLAVNGVASCCMTIINKYIISNFPFPFFVIAVQNLVSVLCFAATIKWLPIKPITMQQMLMFLPTTIMFSIILWTSLNGLSLVSVTLTVIARNSVPVLNALLEVTFFGLKLSGDSFIALIFIFTGSMLYSLTDLSLSSNGIIWLAINLTCIVLTPIIEKRLLAKLLTNQDQTPTGVTFIRNMLSVPILFGLSLLMEDSGKIIDIVSHAKLPGQFLVIFAMSCIFGYALGISYFTAISLISTTSNTIAQTFYKLITILLGLVVYGSQFKATGWIGIAMSFSGILWYTLLQNIPPERQMHTSATGKVLILVGVALLVVMFLILSGQINI